MAGEAKDSAPAGTGTQAPAATPQGVSAAKQGGGGGDLTKALHEAREQARAAKEAAAQERAQREALEQRLAALEANNGANNHEQKKATTPNRNDDEFDFDPETALDLSDDEVFDAKAIKTKLGKALAQATQAAERRALRAVEQRETQREAQRTVDGILGQFDIYGDPEVGEMAKRTLFAKLPELKTLDELKAEAANVAKVFSRTKAASATGGNTAKAPVGTGAGAGGGATLAGEPDQAPKSASEWASKMKAMFAGKRQEREAGGG